MEMFIFDYTGMEELITQECTNISLCHSQTHTHKHIHPHIWKYRTWHSTFYLSLLWLAIAPRSSGSKGMHPALVPSAPDCQPTCLFKQMYKPISFLYTHTSVTTHKQNHSVLILSTKGEHANVFLKNKIISFFIKVGLTATAWAMRLIA